jgi:hypothetical protein
VSASAGTCRYQVVLKECEPYVIARIDELEVQVVASSVQGGVGVAREQALHRLARYAKEGYIPDPVEKWLATIELPLPRGPQEARGGV